MDKTSDFPWDGFEVFRENHILDLLIPGKFRGGDESSVTCCLILEEISYSCLTLYDGGCRSQLRFDVRALSV